MSAMDNMIDKAFSDWRKEYPYAHPVQDRIAFDSGFHAGMRATRPAPAEAEVEAAAIAICAVKNDITVDGARYEWPNMTDHAKDGYRRMARAALGVES